MSEQQLPPSYAEAIQQGWRRDLKAAVDAALVRDGIPIGQPVEIHIQVVRLSENPIHDYKVHFS